MSAVGQKVTDPDTLRLYARVAFDGSNLVFAEQLTAAADMIDRQAEQIEKLNEFIADLMGPVEDTDEPDL